MIRKVCTAMAVLALVGCDATGPDDDDDEEEFENLLQVTARSATTLSVQWDAMGSTNTYTVDFLPGGSANCSDFPSHPDGAHVTGTSTRLTGLTPATRYHLHVHPLPHASAGTGEVTNVVMVSTLAAGAAEQPVTASDYEVCDQG
jgi:hypothetical protein